MLVHSLCDNIDVYEIDFSDKNKNTKSPTILLIGGTHGNEPAGAHALEQFINDIKANKLKFGSGKLIVIPRTNTCGLSLYVRGAPLTDINRNYPKSLDKEPFYNINKHIADYVKQSDFIIDLHEGWSYHKINKDSMGSTVTPSNTKEAQHYGQQMINHINNTIMEPEKKFTLLSDEYFDYNIEGTLRSYANLLNKEYILIETSGQNEIQPLELRSNQMYSMMLHFLNHKL